MSTPSPQKAFGTFDNADLEALAKGEDFHVNNLASFIEFAEQAKVDASLWTQIWQRNFVAEDGMLRDLFYKYVKDDCKIEEVEDEFKEQVINILRVMHKHSTTLIQKRMEKSALLAQQKSDFFKVKKNMHHAYVEHSALQSAPLTTATKPVNIVVVGDSKVGKSHFLSACKGNAFETEVKSIEDTVHMDLVVQSGDKEVDYKVDIVDTDSIAGDSEARMKLLRQADAVIVLFSVTDIETLCPSFELNWTRELMMIAPKARWILCGNKVDQRNIRVLAESLKKDETLQMPVTPEEGVAMAKNYGFHAYIEISNKWKRNVTTALDIAVRSVYGGYQFETKTGQTVTNVPSFSKNGKCSIM